MLLSPLTTLSCIIPLGYSPPSVGCELNVLLLLRAARSLVLGPGDEVEDEGCHGDDDHTQAVDDHTHRGQAAVLAADGK